jgi:hypothetical protein
MFYTTVCIRDILIEYICSKCSIYRIEVNVELETYVLYNSMYVRHTYREYMLLTSHRNQS